MKSVIANEPIHIYSYESPEMASRIISKLRNPDTKKAEFTYYIQSAYEMLFQFCASVHKLKKSHTIIKTPVNFPTPNYAVHNIFDFDETFNNSVMCVMLRGALLPSMVLSKEIEENTSSKYITPFQLFRIKRDDKKSFKDMVYTLDTKNSFYNLEDLNGKDLIFADPMNATGGSLISVINYLKSKEIKPKSIKFFNVISSIFGALNIIRAHKEVTIYSVWLDPALNEKAYIMPGLGDAGDRLNGIDSENNPRNMIQLLADYGIGLNDLYRSQVREIERIVFQK